MRFLPLLCSSVFLVGCYYPASAEKIRDHVRPSEVAACVAVMREGLEYQYNIWRTDPLQLQYDVEIVQGRLRCLVAYDREDADNVWQYPHETWERRAGDCEDLACMLASVLLYLDFPGSVYVCVSADHAWVEITLLETTLVLDPTGPLVWDKMNPPHEVTAAGNNYVIERRVLVN